MKPSHFILLLCALGAFILPSWPCHAREPAAHKPSITTNAVISIPALSLNGPAPERIVVQDMLLAGPAPQRIDISSLSITGTGQIPTILPAGTIFVGALVLEGASEKNISAGKLVLEGANTKQIAVGSLWLDKAGTKIEKPITHYDNKSNDAKPEAQPTAEQPKHVRSTTGDGLVSIKLISVRPHGGTVPFDIKTIRGAFVHKPDAPAPTEKDPPVHSVTAPPATTSPTAPTEHSQTPTLRRASPNALVASPNCAGQSDGPHCFGADLVTCYKEGVMNTQNCANGCNPDTRSCNAYKP